MDIKQAFENATQIKGWFPGLKERTINRDMCVTETGEPVFVVYTMIVDGKEYDFTASQMRKFAQTWQLTE